MRLLLLVASSLVALACAPSAPPPPAAARLGADALPTDGGSWRVAWSSAPAPPPLNRPFSVSVDVRASDGALPPQDVLVAVDAGMPGHGHGMTVRPATTPIEAGRWRADGLLFHMPGAWELSVKVTRGVATELARFAVDVPLVAALDDAERAVLLTLSPKPSVPPDPTNRVADDPCAARLGHALFFDTRLSADGKVACATCHVSSAGFANAQRFGHGAGVTARHVPSVLNSGHARWYFWDGRADTAWSQALGPLESPAEHAFSRVGVVRVMAADPTLAAAYARLFGPLPDVSDGTRFPPHARPDPWRRREPHHLAWEAMAPADRDAVTRAFANAGKAIAAHERRLVGGNAPFDAFVAGLRDGDAAKLASLSEPAVRGARLFVGKARCTTCHHGPLLSDLEFHDTRLPPRPGLERDTGRFRGIELVKGSELNAAGPYSDERDGDAARRLERVAQQPENWGQFKTPSLRNVAVTAPYMHDGRFATLREVVRYYSTLEGAVPPDAHSERTLVKAYLTEPEQEDLVAFLDSLTEEPPPSPWGVAPLEPWPPECLVTDTSG